jgi:Fe-S cluster biogenesis protein NfuA
MSAKPCDSCTMIIVNYVDLWLKHSLVASLLDGARLELRELKARSTLLGACTSCPLLRSNLKAAAIEIKDVKHKLDHSSRYTILSPLCEECVSLKGKLLHATKENTELQQEVAYLTACVDKTVLSEKMIEEDLSWVEESATKSTYRFCIGFERCEKRVRRVLLSLFLAPAAIKKRKHSNQPKPITHPIQSHPSTQREM